MGTHATSDSICGIAGWLCVCGDIRAWTADGDAVARGVVANGLPSSSSRGTRLRTGAAGLR